MIVQISVSLLSIDYSDPSVVSQAVLRVGTANFIHFDVMDGKFVKEKSFDHEFVKQTAVGVGMEKDVHLMIREPEKQADKYLKAGANLLSFHVEACKNPAKLIEQIQARGALAGIALSPATPIKTVEKYIPLADYALVMTVKPGKGGQKLLKTTLKKVASLRKKYPSLIIQADGGINDKTAAEVIAAGANILVSGSYIWKSKDPKLAIDLLRNS